MERVTGIEPAQPAWKAGTLPLSYTRVAPKLYWRATGSASSPSPPITTWRNPPRSSGPTAGLALQ